jgi:hypothetical protein
MTQAPVREHNHGLGVTLVLAIAAPLVLFVGMLAAHQRNVARKPAPSPRTHHIGFDLYQ